MGASWKPAKLDVKPSSQAKRISLGAPDIDEVLGGGIVPGSVVLIAGQPGIGKHTLLLQLAEAAAKNISVLYVSGEESAEQVALRGQRLGTKASKLQLATSTSANDIAATIASGEYGLVIIDSIKP